MTQKNTTSRRWATALVTGATAGIGQEIARQLAEGGTNLVLVARDQAKLFALADAYEKEYGVSVEVIAADLLDSAHLLLVEARLRDLSRPVELLVNNAGAGTVGRFHELPIEGEEREIGLNVIALTRLTHAALSTMVQRTKGKILNISSISGLMPGPGMATYSATKAYVTSFSESIHEEVCVHGVTVTVMHPGFTKTEFQERAGMLDKVASVPEMMWMSAAEVAKYSLDAAKSDKVFTAPGWYSHYVAFIEFLPRTLRRLLSRKMNS